VSAPVCVLPDGRRVAIAAEAADRLACAVVVVEHLEVAENPAVWSETAALGDELRAEWSGRQPSQIPGLGEARDLYKSFGMDPSRHRPSSEALLRRVLKGRELYRISNVVDACNLASLRFLLPIGMYDLDLVEGDVTLRTGRPGEEYPGIRKGMVHLAGRLGLFDGAGPFGSPTSDSARTATRDTTTSLLAVIMATAGYPADRLAAHGAEFAGLAERFCGGREACRAVLGGSS
jgi:DNA/RNA-binding domain of Phe-tRNA-synthetase-like protein